MLGAFFASDTEKSPDYKKQLLLLNLLGLTACLDRAQADYLISSCDFELQILPPLQHPYPPCFTGTNVYKKWSLRTVSFVRVGLVL